MLLICLCPKFCLLFKELNIISCFFSDCEKDGQVYVWQGYTGKVELISFTTFLTRPVRNVALGKDHSLILTYDDSLFSCGSNEHGQLGVPSLKQEYMFDPVLVDTLTGRCYIGTFLTLNQQMMTFDSSEEKAFLKHVGKGENVGNSIFSFSHNVF